MSAATGSDPTPATAEASWVGRRFDVEVGAVAHGGHCIARYDGRVVFVRHSLPGELVTVLVTEDRQQSYCRGDAVTILRSAPGRVQPRCPVAGPGGCGGCDFQHASAPTQLELKSAVLRESLTRLGGLTDAEIPWDGTVSPPDGAESVDDASGFRWRTRVGFAVDRKGHAGLHPARSHRVLPLTDCPITTDSVLASGVLGRRWPGVGGIEVAADPSGRTALRFNDSRGRERSRAGARRLVEHAAGRGWRVSAGGFWQVHPRAADTLATAVRAAAGARPGERVLDLYAGVGLFGGVLAGDVGRSGAVLCVESDADAVEDARSNLADLPWAQARTGRVEPGLVASLLSEFRPDVIVCDPTRSGIGRDISELIAGSGARLVYVACDPAAFARDVATMRGAGYGLASLRAFDLFPQTAHVEAVGALHPAPGWPAG